MDKFVPITKIIATIAFSFCAMVFKTPITLAALLFVELMILALAGQLGKQAKALLGLVGFAVFLGALEFLVTRNVQGAMVTGLRMLCMTSIFIYLLSTTKLQDLTAALVRQCKVPYEYAFMFTAALRFVPDFLNESNLVREAQECRGMDMHSNVFKKIKSYTSVVQPLVLKSLGRSETMALSLELRGFGSSKRSSSQMIQMGSKDYAFVALLLAGCALVIYIRMLGI